MGFGTVWRMNQGIEVVFNSGVDIAFFIKGNTECNLRTDFILAFLKALGGSLMI